MKDNRRVEELKIPPSAKISEALRRMDLLKRKLLIVIENDMFSSLLSIGDIQRAIIKGIDLNSQIKGILRSQISVASETDSDEEIRQRMMRGRSEFMPVVSRDGELLRLVFWEDLIGADTSIQKAKLGLPVVIMAGGIGSRLRPLTNVLPKALIPIGDKSIIEQIMDSFLEYECREYYLSINHKAEMIKYYFEDLMDRYGSVHYVEESEFLGTAGSLAMLKDKIQDTFFVSNCDIMVDQDYAEILDYHKSQNNEITIVAAMLNMSVPYGVLNTDCNGQLKSLSEKPELFYKINTGLYILEPSVFENIPNRAVFHITDLMESLVKQNRKVGVFPVSAKSWTDMGNWSEFLRQAKVMSLT